MNLNIEGKTYDIDHVESWGSVVTKQGLTFSKADIERAGIILPISKVYAENDRIIYEYRDNDRHYKFDMINILFPDGYGVRRVSASQLLKKKTPDIYKYFTDRTNRILKPFQGIIDIEAWQMITGIIIMSFDWDTERKIRRDAFYLNHDFYNHCRLYQRKLIIDDLTRGNE